MSNIKIVIAALLIILILTGLLTLFFRKEAPIGKTIFPILQSSPRPDSSKIPIYPQKSFRVLSTDPKDQQTEVYSGEIEISLVTDNDILSDKDFSLEIAPKLPFYFRLTNTYPTKKIIAKVYGGLQTNTTYQLTVKDSAGKAIYSWSFTTSSQTAESSSSLMEDREKELINSYYPLFDYIPYVSDEFDLDYTDHLALEVKIKNPDISKVKQEVDEWIRSKGVDPSTHKINYINAF